MRNEAEQGLRGSRRGSRTTKAALAVTAGLLLTAAFTAGPANAATVRPDTLTTCYTGTNNTVQYYGWCNGTGPTSYRVIVDCSNGDWVLGVERWDGDRRESYGSCGIDGMNALLTENWGYLLCSNDNGDGSYQGYQNRHGDISQLMLSWGGGTSIPDGGNTLCQYDTSGEVAIPDSPSN